MSTKSESDESTAETAARQLANSGTKVVVIETKVATGQVVKVTTYTPPPIRPESPKKQ